MLPCLCISGPVPTVSLLQSVTPVPSVTGMVEMIPNAETLRKIQVEHGVTGSFKDRPLADWLQKHNPGEDEYEKVGLGDSRDQLVWVCLTLALGSRGTRQLCWGLRNTLSMV